MGSTSTLAQNTCLPHIVVHSPIFISEVRTKITQYNSIIDSISGLEISDSAREAIIQPYRQALTLAYNDEMRYKLNDNYNDNADTLINDILKNEANTKYDSTYKDEDFLASLYLEKGSYTELDSIINGWAGQNDKQNMIIIMNILKNLKQNNKTIQYITSDLLMQQQLQQVANDNSQKGYDIAISILQQIYGTEYHEPIEGIDQTKSLLLKPKPENTCRIGLYPNPNNGDMTLNYTIGEKETGELRILDITGRLIEKYELQYTRNSLQIKQPSLQSGVYCN